jgi:hypothetical protein
MMKRMLTVLVLLLLCIACVAEEADLPALARSRGFEVEASAGDGGLPRCDFAVTGASAVMTWTDASHRYSVTGSSAELSGFYLDVLAMGGWERCSYVANGEALLSYGTDSALRCDTLEAYADQVRAILGMVTFANTLMGVTGDYVLNTRSKKFHYPDCSGIRDMNPRNREDFTGARNEVIAMGYSPCGICKP